MILWTSWYSIKDSVRYAECLRAIQLNLENPYITRVKLLCEVPFPETHSKLECIPIESRPSYGTFFRMFAGNELNILVNTDIVLGYADTRWFHRIRPNECFALARYNVLSNIHQPMNTWKTSDMGIVDAYSQDTWAMIGTPWKNIDVFDSIYMGIPGCDNRVTYELHAQGIRIVNPSKTIHTYHLHADESRTYSDSYHDKNYNGLAVASIYLPGTGFSIVHRQRYYITNDIPSQKRGIQTWRVLR